MPSPKRQKSKSARGPRTAAPIDGIRSLRNLWQSDAKLQGEIERAFDRIGFTNSYIDWCIEAAKNGHSLPKSKFIKDNIWGMIEVDGRTVRLLDCPVVQRLRGIKQLGFSYLTYPSAEHSRFIHSLGMACVVSRLLDSIEKRAADDGGRYGDLDFVSVDDLRPITKSDIIHAAILHDVGHMPFSHVTEAALKSRENLYKCGSASIGDFLYNVERTLAKSLQFSEVLSILVILSKRFERFYTDYVSVDHEDRDALVRICCLIAGLPPELKLSGAAELISASVIDADKIDYVNRDAKACGIPVGVDVSRIFLRSGFLRVPASRLKKSGLKNTATSDEILFVVNASGLDTVDEIIDARAALYQRVYLHAVTRGAETTYANALHANLLSNQKIDELTDALGLWSLTDNGALVRLIASPDPSVNGRAERVRNRQLPKKACVFSSSIARMHFPLQSVFPKLPGDEAATIRKQVVNTPLESLSTSKLAGEKSQVIIKEIRAELDRLKKSIPRGRRREVIPKEPLQLLEIIGSAYMDRVQKDCIVLQNGELLRPSSLTSVREQQDASDIFKAVGFVMCDAAWRPLVLIAARSVLCRSTDQLLPTAIFETNRAGADSAAAEEVCFLPRMILDLNGVIRRSGINPQTVRTIIQLATEGGYFDKDPVLGEPEDPESPHIVRISDKLEKFDGQRSWTVRQSSVAAFLDQFPSRLRDEMADKLQNDLIFFDRAEISSSLLKALQDQAYTITALSPNSGNRTRQILEEETGGKARYKNLIFKKDILAGLESDNGELVLVDDNASSGIQATAQLYSWCGVTRADWPAECRSEDGIFESSLNQNALEKLKAKPFKIIVSVGRDEAMRRIKRACKELGLRNFGGVSYVHEMTNVQWSSELEAYLSKVGLSIIARAQFGKQVSELDAEERKFCLKRRFGYGNAGGLVATSLNVPSATVTAVWCPGLYEGRAWMPLLIRRNRLRHLVLA